MHGGRTVRATEQICTQYGWQIGLNYFYHQSYWQVHFQWFIEWWSEQSSKKRKILYKVGSKTSCIWTLGCLIINLNKLFAYQITA